MSSDDSITEDSLYDEIMTIQSSLSTRLLATAPTSVRRIINRTMAHVFYEMYQSIWEFENENSILTATGTNLDAVVSDRLIEPRRLGDFATGSLTFRRASGAESEITVPIGTICYGIHNGVRLRATTTSEGTIAVGGTNCTVTAIMTSRGIVGNVISGFINTIDTPVTGVWSVTNALPFTGGSESETDDELRQRYIDAIWINGRASRLLVKRHLEDVDDVYEVAIEPYAGGDVEIIIDLADGTTSNNDDINDAIEDNLAVGITARGCLAATLNPSVYSVSTSAGGFIWVRPTTNIVSEETFTVTYTSNNGTGRTANVTIPAGTLAGTAVAATMQSTDDRATEITTSSYVGASPYHLLIGMGTYPYLYSTPILVPINVSVTLHLTANHEDDILTSIENSINEFLDQFTIGEDIQWSDLNNFITHEFDSRGEEGEFLTGRQFIGIDYISSVAIFGKGSLINGTGQYIVINSNERIEPGSIIINEV